MFRCSLFLCLILTADDQHRNFQVCRKMQWIRHLRTFFHWYCSNEGAHVLFSALRTHAIQIVLERCYLWQLFASNPQIMCRLRFLTNCLCWYMISYSRRKRRHFCRWSLQCVLCNIRCLSCQCLWFLWIISLRNQSAFDDLQEEVVKDTEAHSAEVSAEHLCPFITSAYSMHFRWHAFTQMSKCRRSKTGLLIISSRKWRFHNWTYWCRTRQAIQHTSCFEDTAGRYYSNMKIFCRGQVSVGIYEISMI